MMERDRGKELDILKQKNKEKQNEQEINKRLDKINVLLAKNKDLQQEIDTLKGSIERARLDQDESGHNRDEQRYINEILNNPNNTLTNEVLKKEGEIRRNLEEIEVIKKNLKKYNSD